MHSTAFLVRSAVAAAVLLVALITPAAGVQAADGSLEIAEVRTDNFPRVEVRLRASLADALPATNLAPENLRVVEDGAAQPSTDLVQLRRRGLRRLLSSSCLTSAEVWLSRANSHRPATPPGRSWGNCGRATRPRS